MKELENVSPDEEETTEKEAWEKVLPAEVETRFRDVDFAHYDISIPSQLPSPTSSPIAAVPLLPRSSSAPASPAVLRDEGSAPVRRKSWTLCSP